jgi:hypothetical protein
LIIRIEKADYLKSGYLIFSGVRTKFHKGLNSDHLKSGLLVVFEQNFTKLYIELNLGTILGTKFYSSSFTFEWSFDDISVYIICSETDPYNFCSYVFLFVSIANIRSMIIESADVMRKLTKEFLHLGWRNQMLDDEIKCYVIWVLNRYLASVLGLNLFKITVCGGSGLDLVEFIILARIRVVFGWYLRRTE